MKAIALACAVLVATIVPATAASIRQTLTMHWTASADEVGPTHPHGAVHLLGRMESSGDPAWEGLSSCAGWHSWDGHSDGLCSVTDTHGDSYAFDYWCDRSAGWPPPPSCADGYWRTTQCGQLLDLPAGASFVCEGTIRARGGIGAYTLLRGTGHMQEFDVAGPAAGYWIIETDYRRP